MSAVTDATLPHEILQPLRRTGLAVVCFLLAAALWAGFAPLATTVSLEGHVLSEKPSLLLQHPYGGQVSEVLVRRHDQVAAGQLLMRLNVDLEQQQLALNQQQKGKIQEENQTIEDLLASVPAVSGGDWAIQLKYQQAVSQSQLKAETARRLGKQAEAMRLKIDFTQKQLSLMKARAGRQDQLLEKGLLRRNDGEALAEQILIVQAELQSDRSSLLGLEDQIAQAQQNATLILLRAREQLAQRAERNAQSLEELARARLDLEDRIHRADVRAPVAGTVSDIGFEAGQSYASRGATLFQLAQPLAQPYVSLVVPIAHADQLRPGMKGRLIVPSLPQRAMPQIDIELQAIAPRAIMDEGGTPQGYRARADLQAGALSALTTALGGQLPAEDTPVQVVVEVRETTFATYLLAPFLAAFNNALQD